MREQSMLPLTVDTTGRLPCRRPFQLLWTGTAHQLAVHRQTWDTSSPLLSSSAIPCSCLWCRTVSSGISGASYYTGTFNTVNRSADGRYVAVSSRGNFYLTWEPGQPFWQPHNRAVARRIQNMGWRADGGLWLLVRGGGLFLSRGTGITEDFEEVQVQSRGFGILDVGYRSQV
jgi:hypothetical protein